MAETIWDTSWVGDMGAESKLPVRENIFAPVNCTAIRAWGEVLIVEAVRRRHPDHELADGMRTRCVFASLGTTDEVETPSERVRLRVLEDKCGMGRESALDPMFARPSWNDPKVRLSDIVSDEEFVAESVSPTSYDEAFIQVDPDRARKYILNDLDPRLLEAILQHSADCIDGYLQSWSNLCGVPESVRDEPSWKVVVPEDAVVEVSNA